MQRKERKGSLSSTLSREPQSPARRISPKGLPHSWKNAVRLFIRDTTEGMHPVRLAAWSGTRQPCADSVNDRTPATVSTQEPMRVRTFRAPIKHCSGHDRTGDSPRSPTGNHRGC